MKNLIIITCIMAGTILTFNACNKGGNFQGASNENDPPSEVNIEMEAPSELYEYDMGIEEGELYFHETFHGENYQDYGENRFVEAKDQPVSTFSIDADGGSYANTRRQLRDHYLPVTASVRVEEFLNYFDYDYPSPRTEAVSVSTELTTCPWKQEHHILRVGLKGKPLQKFPASNYVFLIDVSGSMAGENQLDLLKRGFSEFALTLNKKDRVAIVTYAGEEKLVLGSTSGDEHSTILDAIAKLGSGGSTAGARGIETAYEIARENFIPGGNNRIIIGTDGDFNVGISNHEDLISLIESKRDQGIFLTVLAVGSGNLNDATMEQLANHGNGTYEYLDDAQEIKRVFIHEREKFFTVAKDVKIKLEFDPECVSTYRLIGYENRLMTEEEFEKDSTDAGEIGANQSITALYELKLKPGAVGSPGKIEFAYKKPDEDNSRHIEQTLSARQVSFSQASESTRFACSVAAFGMALKHSNFNNRISYDEIRDIAMNAKTYDPGGYKSEFVELISTAKTIPLN